MATIRPYTGDVTGVRPSSRGFGSASTVVVDCEKGPVFVKAVPNRPGGRRDSLIREGLVNPHVRPVSPALRWQAEDDAWIVLGFEVVEARTADFTPGSADLPAVLDLVARIGDLPLPAIASDWPETRWDRYIPSPADAELRHLAHRHGRRHRALASASRRATVPRALGARKEDQACWEVGSS